MDPSKPLQDAQHERFACELAKGASQDEAYELAGYKRHRSSASRLRTNANVSQRVEWLKQQAASDTVLSIKEKREFIARVFRAKPSEAGMENSDCQLVMTKMGPAALFPDVTALIKIDNDLAGEGSEAKGQGALANLLGRLRA